VHIKSLLSKSCNSPSTCSNLFFFWNIFMNSKKHKYLWNMTKRLMMTLSVMMNRQINSIGFCLTFFFFFLEDITMQCMVLWKIDNGGLTGQRERERGREGEGESGATWKVWELKAFRLKHPISSVATCTRINCLV
jgi:hypothetical protein